MYFPHKIFNQKFFILCAECRRTTVHALPVVKLRVLSIFFFATLYIFSLLCVCVCVCVCVRVRACVCVCVRVFIYIYSVSHMSHTC